MRGSALVVIAGMLIFLGAVIMLYPVFSEYGKIPATETPPAGKVHVCKVTVNALIKREFGGYEHLADVDIEPPLWTGEYVSPQYASYNLQFTSAKTEGDGDSVQVDVVYQGRLLGSGVCYVHPFDWWNPFWQDRTCAVRIDGLVSGKTYTFIVHGRNINGGELGNSPKTITRMISC